MRGLLDGSPVSKGYSGQHLIPVALVSGHKSGQHIVHGTMEALNVPIGGWFVGRGSNLLHTHDFAQLLEEGAFEVRALVCQNLDRAAVDTKHPND